MQMITVMRRPLRSHCSRVAVMRRPLRSQCSRVAVIVGPTTSGKSAFAVELARAIGGEVISADSRQVYRGLNIGTGKITRREMRGVPHHLLNVASPKRIFTAHDFSLRAHKVIADITRRGKVPIIAGGTGFYIDALVGRIALSPVAINKTLRAKLENKSSAQLLALLKRRDPKRASDILAKNEQNNRRRLIRAIEIASNQVVSYMIPAEKDTQIATYPDARVVSYMIPPKCGIVWIGIKPDMQELKKKIRARLIARLKQGMVAEAKHLHADGLSYKRMDQLGLEYRYLARYLKNKITKDELVEQLSAKIWQYARRQIIYWKRNKDIKWFTPSELSVPQIMRAM